MKKIASLMLIIFVFVTLTGCYDAYIKAPEGKNIKISSKPFVETDKSKIVFYALNGIMPLEFITPANSESLLKYVADGTEVTIRYEYTIVDGAVMYLANSYTPTTICSRTIGIDIQEASQVEVNKENTQDNQTAQ